jgi:putative N6-adenine-specific DNA methylase
VSTEEHPAVDLLATCAFGLEAVVVRELGDLGYTGEPISTGRILIRVPAGEECFRAIAAMNLWLRAADRVLVRLGTFPITPGEAGFDDLFAGIKDIAWERWIAKGSSFPVAGRCVRSAIRSEEHTSELQSRLP